MDGIVDGLVGKNWLETSERLFWTIYNELLMGARQQTAPQVPLVAQVTLRQVEHRLDTKDWTEFVRLYWNTLNRSFIVGSQMFGFYLVWWGVIFLDWATVQCYQNFFLYVQIGINCLKRLHNPEWPLLALTGIS